MTPQFLHRCRASDAAQERFARILNRRNCRHCRQPAVLRGWADLPLLYGVPALPITPRCGKPAPERAARHVQQLTGLSASSARLVAQLAGFCLEADT